MGNIYQEENFNGRVNYAVKCFLRGTRSSRSMDACFEMFDGDAVVVALVRRARKNPRLHQAIAAQWGGTFPQSWLTIADRHRDIPTSQLKDLARRQREASKGGSA